MDGSKNPMPESDRRRNLTDSYHTVPQSDNPSTQMPRRRHIAASRILRLPHRGHSCPIPSTRRRETPPPRGNRGHHWAIRLRGSPTRRRRRAIRRHRGPTRRRRAAVGDIATHSIAVAARFVCATRQPVRSVRETDMPATRCAHVVDSFWPAGVRLRRAARGAVLSRRHRFARIALDSAWNDLRIRLRASGDFPISAHGARRRVQSEGGLYASPVT